MLYQVHLRFPPSHIHTQISGLFFMYIMCTSHLSPFPIRRLIYACGQCIKQISFWQCNKSATDLNLSVLTRLPRDILFPNSKASVIINWNSKTKRPRGFIYATKETMALPEWISMCCFRFWIRVNRTPHVGHWKGLSGPLGLGRSVLLVEGAM